MVPEVEKPRIIDIHVRIDCNGCVQKIKKALHNINGIYDLYIDFPQQKITIIGWADPEKIVKALKKTRKIATICTHPEQPSSEPPRPPSDQQPPEGSGAPPPPDASNPPPSDSPPQPDQAQPTQPNSEAAAAADAPPAEPPKDPPPPPEHPPPPEAQPTAVAAETNLGQQQHPFYQNRPREAGEVHTIHHYPPSDYGYRYVGYPNGYYNRNHNIQAPPQPEPTQPPAPAPVQYHAAPAPAPVQYHAAPAASPSVVQVHPPQPVYVRHSYNTYRPSPYVTEYEYVQPPPPPPPRQQMHYNRSSQYYGYEDQNYQNVSSNGYGNGNITSFFSDENPNACVVM